MILKKVKEWFWNFTKRSFGKIDLFFHLCTPRGQKIARPKVRLQDVSV